jgi:large conductance mechanosensitive channel
MGLLKEFKAFAMRGNVVDMAVGIIIGAAFGKIVTSMVNDIVMPLVGALTGGGSFGDQFVWLGAGDKPATIEAAKAAGQAYIAWGPFLQTTIDFLIIAFVIFLMIKAMNRATSAFQKPSEGPAPTTKDCPRCCSTIAIKATRCPNCTSELGAT